MSTPNPKPTLATAPAPAPSSTTTAAAASTTPTPTPTPTPIHLDKKSLYILLWDTNHPSKYHWGLFISQTRTSGLLFHQTRNDTLTPTGSSSSSSSSTKSDSWKLIIEHLEDVNASEGLLAVLKVGKVEDVDLEDERWVGVLKEVVRGVDGRVGGKLEFARAGGGSGNWRRRQAQGQGREDGQGGGKESGEEFTCRTWVLGCVYELADGGFIGMMPDWGTVGFVEEEARRLAGMAREIGVRVVVESQWFVG